MPTDFHYVPLPPEPISGGALIEQTERAFNELGAKIDESNVIANNALNTANNALDTAANALQSAEDAVNIAQEALDATNQIDGRVTVVEGVAAGALDRANDAYDLAASADSKAGAAAGSASGAQATADSALSTARSAQQSADNAQTTAAAAMDLALSFREPLAEDTVFYIRDGGDDTQDGLTEETALATMGGAVALLHTLDPRGYVVVLDVGSGIFTVPVVTLPAYDHTNLYIQGAGVGISFFKNDTAQEIIGAFSISDCTLLHRLRTDVGRTISVRSSGGTGHVRFRACYLYAANGGIVSLPGALVELEPDPASPDTGFIGIYAADGGKFDCNPWPSFVAVNNPVFSPFAQSLRGGAINFYASTFSGEATGQKFTYGHGGTITAQGTDEALSHLFGDTPGGRVNSSIGLIAANGILRGAGHVSATGVLSTSFGVLKIEKNGIGDYFIYPLGGVTAEPKLFLSLRSFLTSPSGDIIYEYGTRNSEYLRVRTKSAAGDFVDSYFVFSFT